MEDIFSLQTATYIISQVASSDITTRLYRFDITDGRIMKKRFVAKVNGYYVEYMVIKESAREMAKYLFDPFDEHEDLHITFNFEPITIDTVIGIDEMTKRAGEEIIGQMQQANLIPHYEYPFPDDLTTRHRFFDFYDTVKDLAYGDCVGKWGKFIPFIDRFIQLYGIKNATVLNLRRNSQRKRLIGYRGETGLVNRETMFVYKDSTLYIPETFREYFGNTHQNIVIIPLDIEQDEDHLNVVIFDKTKREFERFEPNGDYIGSLDVHFEEIFRTLLPDWKYIKPLDYCPAVGPQSLIGEPGCPPDSGFCVTLSMIYACLRIRNPEYTKEEVIHAMNLLGSFTLRKFNTFVDMLIPDNS